VLKVPLNKIVPPLRHQLQRTGIVRQFRPSIRTGRSNILSRSRQDADRVSARHRAAVKPFPARSASRQGAGPLLQRAAREFAGKMDIPVTSSPARSLYVPVHVPERCCGRDSMPARAMARQPQRDQTATRNSHHGEVVRASRSTSRAIETPKSWITMGSTPTDKPGRKPR